MFPSGVSEKGALQGSSTLATREVKSSANSRRLEVEACGELADTRIVDLRQRAVCGSH
jgi:hypothetical protein